VGKRPKFFATPGGLRGWLEEFHRVEAELWVGLHKKTSGRPSVTWPQLVDELLCFGWIDGVRKSIDDTSYMIRVTPRKAKSTWSAINIRRVAELSSVGVMHPAGLQAFEARTDGRSAIYSYEQRKTAKLTPAMDRRLRSSRKAWDFFRAQAPSHQRTVIFWVMNARKEETRLRRLERVIWNSERGRRIAETILSRKKN
jgi:uncharacterized protein YdeI (YjbR/CyaY-like superfamily)